MPTPEELLDQVESDLNRQDFDEEQAGIDRREFMFLSLVAAAATAFGAKGAIAQGVGGAAAPAPGAGGGRGQQPQAPPVPLENAEFPAVQFQPYPGGTGAYLQKLVKEQGPHVFDRAVFTVEKWNGAVPTDPDEIAFLPAHRLSALLKAKKVTSMQLTEIYLNRLRRLNPILLCAVTILEDRARAEAKQADAEIQAGKYRGPLHGLPYGVKDLFAVKGAVTTWGSKDFETRMIDNDAEVVVRLRDAGAVLIAKLATGLFAQGDQWSRGRTNNPWNISLGSSGSSAGPASATAAGCVAFGIGTETSGSIVSPTSRCGLSALRPTFGRTSRAGGMALGWSMDRVGPITRTVEDAAMVFNAFHGVDEKDPSTVTTPFNFDRNLKLASVRVGVDPQAPKEFVDKLKELGMSPVDVGPRPTVSGANGGALNVEEAAAFDYFVQIKAKEIGLDLNNLPEPAGRGGGGGGGRGGAAAAAAAAGGAPVPPPNPLAGSDWNPRFVSGRRTTGLEYMQGQRRRLILTTKWAEYMKDIDMFIANPNADVGANSSTGHPCAVVQYKFDVPQQGGGGGRGGAAPAPSPELKPQPICATIVGQLYNDDKILSVAHQFQIHTDIHLKHPSI
jgi:amidase